MKNIWAVSFSVIFLSISCNASSLTSGADFLKIPQSARLVGLSEALTARAESADALRINVSGIAADRYAAISATHCVWLWGVNSETINVIYPLPVGSIGISGQFLADSRVTAYDDWGDSLGGVAANNSYIKLAYGMRAVSRGPLQVLVGVGAGYISRVIGEMRAGGVNFDVGASLKYYSPERDDTVHTAERYFAAGIAIRNIGGKINDSALPTEFVLGVAVAPIKHLVVSLDINQTITSSFKLMFGGEYTVLDCIDVRVGGRLFQKTDSVTAGIGFHRQLSFGRVSIDYAFDVHKYLGNAHYITVGYSLVPSIKRRDARDYYFKGLESFIDGDYDRAEYFWRMCLRIDPTYSAAQERIDELERARQAQSMIENLEQYDSGYDEYMEGAARQNGGQ